MAKIGHKILVGSSQTQLALFASFFLLRLLFKLARLLLCLKIRWKMLGQRIMISSLSVNFLKFWRLDYFQNFSKTYLHLNKTTLSCCKYQMLHIIDRECG